MPLNIFPIQGTAPTPQIVAPRIVVQRAQQGGNANAALALAYTDPIINIDQTGLNYRQRYGPSGIEFIFDTGTLRLTLRQDMLISNTLSNCAQQKWIAHENGHVRDNQIVMTRMDAAIRADSALQSIFIRPRWTAINRFQPTEQTIFRTVSTIFKRLTLQAVAAHDTQAEYKRVHRDILKNCSGPFIYEVNKGDTLGQIANFFYGRISAWKSIYRANQKLIGSNPDLIRVGQRLVIPSSP